MQFIKISTQRNSLYQAVIMSEKDLTGKRLKIVRNKIVKNMKRFPTPSGWYMINSDPVGLRVGFCQNTELVDMVFICLQ